MTSGSAAAPCLATTLYEAGLVDRLIVKLNPVLFGSGIPLLDRTVAARPMELVETRPYPSGHVLLTYQIGS